MGQGDGHLPGASERAEEVWRATPRYTSHSLRLLGCTSLNSPDRPAPLGEVLTPIFHNRKLFALPPPPVKVETPCLWLSTHSPPQGMERVLRCTYSVPAPV